MLVPEIALTPQLAARFRARFGDDVAVLHSALPPGERLAAWRRLRAGEVGIAVGARSAVFAPVQRLGVMVVDEEHDGSFKQDEGVRYNARDLAVVRAQRAGAVAILGSATPSLETFRNAERGRFRRLALPERATPRPLPSVEIIDLRRHPPGADGLLSPLLAEADRREPGRARADHPVPQPARLLDGRAVPRVRPRRALHALRGLDDLPPGPRPADLSLLRRTIAGARALPEPRLRLAEDRAPGHGHRAGRGAGARALPRGAGRPPRSRHRRPAVPTRAAPIERGLARGA